jgi:hypothetical protein
MKNLYICYNHDHNLLYFTEVTPREEPITEDDGWFISVKQFQNGTVEVWTETLLDRESGLDMDQAEECVLRFLKARGWDIP